MDESKYTDLAVKVESIAERSKSNTHRIEELETDMKETKDMQITMIKLANGIEKMGEQLTDVKTDMQDIKHGQNELSEKVTTLENRPAQETKRIWDSIVEKALWLVISGVIGFLIAQLIQKI